MTPEVYLDTQNKLLYIARLALDLNLDGFLAAIEHADTLGPVLNPSLWNAGHRPMERIRRLAEAAKAFQGAAADALQRADEPRAERRVAA